MKVRGQFPHSEAKTRGIALGLVVKNSFILVIDLLFQCSTKLKINIKIFIFTSLCGTTKKALWRPIPSPPNPLEAPERNAEIKFQAIFNWANSLVIFEATTVEEDILCEKSCQTYSLKKWSVSNFFNPFVVKLWNKIFVWRFWR